MRLLGLSRPSWGLLFLGALCLAACRKPISVLEQEALKNIKKENSYVLQFQALYPSAEGLFFNFEGIYGPTLWRSRVGLNGRYLLEMKMEVVMDRDRVHVVKTRAPQFWLLTVDSLLRDAEGTVHMKFRGEAQIDFGPAEWLGLVEKKGDLSALGIQPGAEPPLQGFDQVWREF